nr:pyridoxal phosphate-dependent aminotransferase [Inmirania thermothiophila]
MRLAARAEAIEPFRVMDVLARARALEAAGADVIHMEVGEPDFPTPRPIVEAGRRALAEGRTGYTPALGIPELREAIARHYRERHGLAVAPQRIVVTPGASGALLLVLAALLGRDETVALADPGYPCNRHFARAVEGRAVALPGAAEHGYQPTAAALAALDPPPRLVLVASPANPTGTLIAPAELAAIHAWCRRTGAALVVDEIYHGLVYEGEAPTALALGEDVLVINSFSKYFGMTGWRLGWLVAPEGLVRALERLAQNLFIAAPTPAQHAALAAFTPATLEIAEERRAAFRARREFLVPALRGLGFSVPVTPQGAFYVYADSRAFDDDCERLCRRLLEEAHVAVTPGTDFGRHEARGHVRFAYTTGIDRLERAVERIRRLLAQG